MSYLIIQNKIILYDVKKYLFIIKVIDFNPTTIPKKYK